MNLLYITSELIFSDIKNCEDEFELDDFMELFEIFREWSFCLEFKINRTMDDKQVFPDREEELDKKIDKLTNAFCVLMDDSMSNIAELMDDMDKFENLTSRLFTWLLIPTRNVKNLLLFSEFLGILKDKKSPNCEVLQGFASVVNDVIDVVRLQTDSVEDLQF